MRPHRRRTAGILAGMRRWLVGWVLWSGGCIENNPMFVDPTVGDEAGETTSAPPATDSAATTEPPDPTSPTTGPGPETTGLDTEGTMGPTTEGSSTGDPMPVTTCGDGVVDRDEECDDANNEQNDDCLDNCLKAACGDDFVQYGMEECDDGNFEDGDTCMSCALAKCGDGAVQDGEEECDDGNVVDNDGCREDCSWPVCGDGQKDELYEECDDGEFKKNDGCEPDCKLTEKIIFVSSQLYTGAMGGLTGADFECSVLADNANLPGVYKAWLSAGLESPSTRMSQYPYPYVRSDRSMIAPNWETLLTGSLMGPIDLTEHMEMHMGSPLEDVCGSESRVRTNTLASGMPFSTDEDCLGWTSDSGTTLVGSFVESDQGWSEYCMESTCDSLAPIYCVQQ